MGLWKGTKKTVGHMIDLRVEQWVDFSTFKNMNLFLWDHLKTLFTIKKTQHPENFEEAVDRLALSKEALTKQSKRYLKLSLFFLLMTAALIIYALVLYKWHNWMGTIICFSLSLYALSLAFRFHFWHFQISQEKLGCSVWEWYHVMSSIKSNKRKNQP